MLKNVNSLLTVKKVQEILRDSPKNSCKTLREYLKNVLKIFKNFHVLFKNVQNSSWCVREMLKILTKCSKFSQNI